MTRHGRLSRLWYQSKQEKCADEQTHYRTERWVTTAIQYWVQQQLTRSVGCAVGLEEGEEVGESVGGLITGGKVGCGLSNPNVRRIDDEHTEYM